MKNKIILFLLFTINVLGSGGSGVGGGGPSITQYRLKQTIKVGDKVFSLEDFKNNLVIKEDIIDVTLRDRGLVDIRDLDQMEEKTPLDVIDYQTSNGVIHTIK